MHIFMRSVFALACALLVVSQAKANLFGADEPLPPLEVFVPSIERVDNEHISIRFSIEEAYYLYRDKLAFTVETINPTPQSPAGSFDELISGGPGNIDATANKPVTLHSPVFEDATIIEDDFFGQQAIFRNSTLVHIPYSAEQQVDSIEIGIRFQGCADIGLCYPPTDTTLVADMSAATSHFSLSTSSEAPLSSSSLASVLPGNEPQNQLRDLLSNDEAATDLLPPELAFLPQIIAQTQDTIDLTWFIEDGYYLYRDKLSFSLDHPPGAQVTKVLVSEGLEQHDEFFGNVFVLRNRADVRIHLDTTDSLSAPTSPDSSSVLTIRYQGCADLGVCFPPKVTTLDINPGVDEIPATIAGLIPLGSNISGAKPAAGARATAENSSLTKVAGKSETMAASTLTANSGAPVQSEQDRLFNLLGANSLWLTVATFFGLGLLLAFTPCVLPMIPILSSLIVGQGQTITTGRAFQLSLVYVLVMASTYALVGVLVGLSGYNVQAFLQNPIVLSGIALLFVLLSLSMFGFYELQMPASVQAKLTQWSNNQGGGQVGGVATMGFISTLIVGPCITAPLAGALLYIAKTGDALVGGAALFALGLGMGAPLLLIGTSAGKLVPKAGAWMNTVKYIFGILMLGMAIYMLSRFLPGTLTMALYGVLAIMSGVYLGATDSLTRDSSGLSRFGKGLGLAVCVYGAALFIGAMAGGGSYTAPLTAFNGSSASGGNTTDAKLPRQHSLPFQRVKSVQDLQNAVAQAKAMGRPVMLDFYADWCVSCKEMDAFTFSDSRVQELLASAVVVQADVTKNDQDDQELLKAFDLFGPPGIIFYNAAGQELRAARVVGFMDADNFSSHIQQFLFSADT